MSALQPPVNTGPNAVRFTGFGLFPFRSPLLRESLEISFPQGTEMFHFPCLPPPSLCVQLGVLRFYLSGLPHSGIPG